ncbi:MAG: demethylmenaquinone methyltransferase / 2-methoxy-6-polyprenyl-1,4-benzoquinol methylase [Pelagibacterales bacterium]|jgi:demethylmenaquinone methyltransferase/2-methoxy-6-polyprenyl-1,4-benzoquinol methylase|nr:demethylmenaquinone methyltransferase / 2-methoxy-6-polyprenyl-1,4-benzoquinol methylase [Pelagibacterales bacterium]
MKIYNEDKKTLVNSVFSEVYKKYDFMNDVMSFGIHRLWKKNMINWIKPQENTTLIDVASGTGDLAKIFSEKTNNKSKIICLDSNRNMLNMGKEKLKFYKNIQWKIGSAEKLPFKDNTFDYYTISYGIRNVTNINKCLSEAFRVLKLGGRFMCLEFSKIENETLNKMYKQYSKSIPLIGKLVIGNSMPYDYLVKSIEKFYNQEDLLKMIKNNGFSDVKYRNLSSGISAIHSAWKI